MQRLIGEYIESWAAKDKKYPLIIDGARQVGKTYIIENTLNNGYNKFYKYDLLRNTEILNMFENSSDLVNTLKQLALLDKIDLYSKKTVIFFDEIQRSPKIIEGLKYFYLEFPSLNIICSGSLLGVMLKKMDISYPVGYVEELIMYPLNFKEFLTVTDNERFIPEIENAYDNNLPLEDAIHNRLMSLYREYLILGGMPELVNNYLDNGKELIKTNFSILKKIEDEYQKDMTKYVEDTKDKIRIKRIYDVIVPQLEKSNPKFTYAKIDKYDNRKRDYITALDWLEASSIVYKCTQITNPIYPINAYLDAEKYKLFLNDVGILSYKAGINRGNISLDGDYPFKGVLTENYVACELKSYGGKLLYFSKKNENNNGLEIDFIVQFGDKVIPIEVKSSLNTKSKSLETYNNEFKPAFSIRISSKNFGYENNIKSIPLYAIFCLEKNINI